MNEPGTVRLTEALVPVVVEVAETIMLPAGGIMPAGDAVIEIVPDMVSAWAVFGSASMAKIATKTNKNRRIVRSDFILLMRFEK